LLNAPSPAFVRETIGTPTQLEAAEKFPSFLLLANFQPTGHASVPQIAALVRRTATALRRLHHQSCDVVEACTSDFVVYRDSVKNS
jgi:hypothetical protein